MARIIRMAGKVTVVFLISFVFNFFVTIYTAQSGESKRFTEEGCLGIDYIISGFPIRDVYIKSYNGGECGLSGVRDGFTGIGGLQYTLNWMFWAGIGYYSYRYINGKRKQ